MWFCDTIFDIKWKDFYYYGRRKNEIREVAKYSHQINAVRWRTSLVQKKIMTIKETDGSDMIDYERFIFDTNKLKIARRWGIRLIRQTFS